MKEGVYFLKHSEEYDEKKDNVYLDWIPMLEIKNVFVKQEQSEIVSVESNTSPITRSISWLSAFKTPSFKPIEDKIDIDESYSASRRGYEFQIETFEEDSQAAGSRGECAGRSYHIRVDSEHACKLTVAKLNKIYQKRRSEAERKSRVELMQGTVLRSYKSPLFQTIVAGLILAVINFFFVGGRAKLIS